MCSAQAAILHADLDAFYASVEQRDDPLLRGRPIAVGGGVVLAASYEARRTGVRTAMSGREARRRCPELQFVSPRMGAYAEASRAVFELFEDTTPLVEGLSIDEAFLDVSGLRRVSGTPVEIAVRLRRRVADEVGLPLSIGIARTKFLAKVASAVAKPDGLLVVEPQRELEFLHPLPVRRLWGVGPVTAEKLAARDLSTVGDVAGLHEATLVSILGPAAGRHLHALAHNRDPRPVEVGRRRRSIGAQRALGRGSRDVDELEAVLLELVERVAPRLRSGERAARTVTIRFRFGDFSRDARSRSLLEATNATAPLLEAARQLLHDRRAEIEARRLTLLGVSLTNLQSAQAVQLPLPFGGRDRSRLDGVLDSIRDRYGRTAVRRARLLTVREGVSVPQLPDRTSGETGSAPWVP